MTTVWRGPEITATDVARMPNQDLFLAWVRRHGLNPDNTWSVRIVGPLVRARVYRLNAEGRKQMHPRRRDRVWMRTIWLRRRGPLPSVGTEPTDDR